MHINITHVPNDKSIKKKKKVVKSWEESKKHLFFENVDQSKIQELIDRIDNVTTVQRNDVNDFMNEIENIFENAKNASFASVEINGTYAGSISKDKLWFSSDCRSARKKYHLAKRIYKYNRTQENYNQLLNNSKKYKKELNKSIVKHKRATRKKVREMRQKSPNDYWRYINSLNSKKSKSDIKLDTLYDFFKNLNNTEYDENDLPQERANNENFNNDILNEEITHDEIITCIKNLKNG